MNLNAIFTSHMVFAANKPIRVYGEGEGEIKLTFCGEERTVVAQMGKWLVEFEPMSYGGPYTLTAVSGNEKVMLDDIYVGEVFLFSGQSNMQFKCADTDLDYEKFETDGMIRLFSTDGFGGFEHFKPQDGWVVCKKEEIQYWTAIGFLASYEILKKKNVAIGVIGCYQGASVIESWVPKGTFEKIGIEIPIEKRCIDHIQEPFGEWNVDGTLYEFSLSEVIPFALSSVIWYQGESDTSLDEAAVYCDELKELIRVWRNDFMNTELPFVIIQIADYDDKERAGESWKLIQEAQLKIQDVVSNVKTVISADVCETNDIHPKTKDKLALRVADAIMELLYR